MHRGQGHVGEGQEIEGVALPPNTISVVHPVDHDRASGASFWPQEVHPKVEVHLPAA